MANQNATLAVDAPLALAVLTAAGASRWELYRDGERPDRLVEQFRIPSWGEHLRQHEGRLTATDQQVEEAALSFSDPPARGEHLLPPGPGITPLTGRSRLRRRP